MRPTIREREGERENLDIHQRRDTSERLHTHTLANYDYDTRVCKRVPTTTTANERTSERESPFFSFAETHALIAAILSAI